MVQKITKKNKIKSFVRVFLNDTVSNYNNTIHITTKAKAKDGSLDLFIGYASSVIKNKPKPKTGDHVRITKYKNIFAKALVGEKLKILLHI